MLENKFYWYCSTPRTHLSVSPSLSFLFFKRKLIQNQLIKGEFSFVSYSKNKVLAFSSVVRLTFHCLSLCFHLACLFKPRSVCSVKQGRCLPKLWQQHFVNGLLTQTRKPFYFIFYFFKTSVFVQEKPGAWQHYHPVLYPLSLNHWILVVPHAKKEIMHNWLAICVLSSCSNFSSTLTYVFKIRLKSHFKLIYSSALQNWSLYETCMKFGHASWPWLDLLQLWIWWVLLCAVQ